MFRILLKNWHFPLVYELRKPDSMARSILIYNRTNGCPNNEARNCANSYAWDNVQHESFLLRGDVLAPCGVCDDCRHVYDDRLSVLVLRARRVLLGRLALQKQVKTALK